MNINTFDEACKIQDDIINIRKELHRNPEIGNNEYKTAEIVESFLKELGIETEHILGTAVIGTLKGDYDGKTVALRADMDALPVKENTGCSYCSQSENMMHACGHDVHMASVLGAAKILSANRDKLHGTVKFLFQPDEEGSGGAVRMIEQGCLAGVDAVFGAHVAPDIEKGKIGVRYGKFYAASDMFYITVHGKGAHGATPEKGVDALSAGCEIVCRLKKLPEKISQDRCILSVGTIESGSAINIISHRTEITGIIRTLGKENRENMKKALKEVIESVNEEYGTTADIKIKESYMGIVNTDEETTFAHKVITELLGEENVIVIDEPLMTTEDFGYFIDKTGGSFYHIGAGCTSPLHSSDFLPDENAPVIAAAVHSAIAAEYLK